MKRLFLIVLFLGSFALAQDAKSQGTGSDASKTDHSSVVQGCVSRLSGDYVLIKQNPAMTYQLQATGKIRLRNYLGKRVEVSGEQGPTMSTSSDALNKTGSASSVMISVRSIKTIEDQCNQR